MRHTRIIRAGLATSAITAVVLFAAGNATAATQNITLSPTSVDTTLDAGTVKSGTFQVINTGDVPFVFTTAASAYRVDGEEYTQDFTPLPGAPDVASWFTVPTDQIELQPGKVAEVPYSIRIPVGTPAGGYYAVIFAQTKTQQTQASVVVNERVGQIFYLTVSGQITSAGRVASWQSRFLQSPPLTASLRLENSGGTHYLSTIHVTASDMFGNAKFSFDTKKQVLPQTTRRVEVPWDKSPSFGLFKVSGTVNYLGRDETLPTHYVLIMSRAVRIIILGICVVLFAGMLGVLAYRKKHEKHQKTKP